MSDNDHMPAPDNPEYWETERLRLAGMNGIVTKSDLHGIRHSPGPQKMSNFLLQSAAATEFMREMRERLLAEGWVEMSPNEFHKRGATMLTVPETCITEGFVMPPWQQSSFPLLAIARQYDLDYGDVCLVGDAQIKLAADRGYTLSQYEHEASERLLMGEFHDAIEAITVVAVRMPRSRPH